MRLKTSSISLIAVLGLVIFCGCTTAEIDQYNYKVKHAMDWTQKPETQEQIKYWWFTANPDPQEKVSAIISLGNWVFDEIQCQADKLNIELNSRNPRAQPGYADLNKSLNNLVPARAPANAQCSGIERARPTDDSESRK